MDCNLPGLLPPTITLISLTPTYVAMNITQPEHSLPSNMYIVSLRLAGNDSQMCQHNEDGIVVETMDGMVEFDQLDEFSVYNLTVTTRNDAYRAYRSSTMDFTTLSTCKFTPFNFNVHST